MKTALNRFALFTAFIFTFSFAAPVFAAKSTSAITYIEQSLAAYDNVLYVYKDFGDGVNSYTQKSWVGDSYHSIPSMDEGAKAYSGTTGIMAELNFKEHLWGGYIFNIGALTPGSTVPENNYGQYNAGYDLTGASKLVFYARGETGDERVEFFMGGLGYINGKALEKYPDSTKKISLGVVRLTTEWKRYEITLSGKDLNRIGCGFGWVASNIDNYPHNYIKFYIDEIRFEFKKSRRIPVFLASYTPEYHGSDGEFINSFAYLYDNAAAIIALSYAGKTSRAMQLADAIVYAQNYDRYYSDGRLRNAYSNGSPKSGPGWTNANGREYARLPGFYNTHENRWQEDYYAVSTSTGNMAWAMLALITVYEKTGKAVYLDSAEKIGNFILTLADSRGGFYAGYEGWDYQQVKAKYKSTEHNIDLIPAFTRLAKQTKGKKAADYNEAAKHAKAFVLTMYDENTGCFYTGTKSDGVTMNKSVLPLDSNTWALLALGTEFKQGRDVMTFVENNMASGRGYDFNTDKDGVWFEGTAQVSLVYRQLGDTKKADDILTYLKSSANTNGSINAANRDGITTGFTVSGLGVPWLYYKRGHLGATAWLAFASMHKNPLAS